jgi:hypothetical protein
MAAIVARAEAVGFDRRPVVFEGNRPAELADNDAFRSLLAAPPAEVARGYDLWLGEPLTLRPGHLAVRMRRQARGNLLLVGNDEPVALHLALAAAASWSAAQPRGQGWIRTLDLTNVDDPLHDAIALLAGLPTPGVVCRGPQAEALLAEAIDELRQRREAAAATRRGAPPGPPQLLVLFGLQRGRMFDRGGLKPPPCAALLAQLLAEGPDVGLHTILWVDTWASATRGLASGDLAEFGARVALTGGDALRALGAGAPPSSALRRGTALVVTEDEPDRPQKLRCYGPGTVRWLRELLPEEP